MKSKRGRSYTKEEKLRIIQAALNLHANGVPWIHIAKQLGTHRQTLANWVKEFKKTAPVPLKPTAGSSFSEWEREEAQNLERVRKIFITLLDKIEAGLNGGPLSAEDVTKLNSLTSTVVSIMRGMTEVNHLLSLHRKDDSITSDRERLRELRQAHLKQYGQGEEKAG